jgi:site-specific recombinase XerD
MTFRVVHKPSNNHARCPYRIVEQATGREIDWINQYLDYETLRRLADATLRTYAHELLHFLRWWESVHHTDAVAKNALTETTLLDYVRFQSGQERELTGATINQRVAIVDRALRVTFPGAPGQSAPVLQTTYWQRAPMGIGKPRPALSRLRVKTPKRTIVPLSVDEVARFWSSFRNSRDLAIVGLMLLQGLRSQEVLDLNRDGLLLSEAQIRVRGKGSKTRFLPLAPEANQLLDHYLRLERPQTSTNALFVSLKGPARGVRMTPAGLRSLVSTSPSDHRRKDGQPPPVPPHLCLRYGARRSQSPGPDAVDGTRANPDDDGLCASHSSRGLSAVCACRGAAHQARAEYAIVKLSRYAPLEHPLAHQFQRAIESLTAALAPDSALFLRSILEEFAWTAQLPDLAHLIRREDIPRIPQRLPRPLTAEQDRLIQQELMRRNNLPANVFLLLRHTGMRIGECADLSYDCLHNVGPDWTIHVPLGKLNTERMVPVDSFVCELVQRLRFFRSFDLLPADGRLLARHSGKQTLMKRLRPYLYDVSAAVGISAHIVPHQLRHTYDSEMVRAGVSLPALMTLLGHVKAEMTMKYVLVAGNDLQREFHLARSQPRHLAPQPKAPTISARAGLEGVLDSLLFAQHAIEMFRRSLPDGPPRHCLDRLSNRLTKILSEARNLNPAG